MAASALQSTSPLTRHKRTMMPSAKYEARCMLSSHSLEVARRAGIGVAAERATSRKARPPSPESGRVADKGVGGPPMMEARRAGALPTPCATSKGGGNLMRRDKRERWEPHEVRRADTGAAASELVLEVLAAKRKMRSPRSEDGSAVQQGHRRLAEDRGAVGDGLAASKRDAAEPQLALSRRFVGFVEGKDVDELLRADEVMSSPKN